MVESAKKIFKKPKHFGKHVTSPIAKAIAPTVLDAFTDQNGQRWVRYGVAQKFHLFKLVDFASDERSVIAQLINIGVIAPSASAKTEFRRAVGEDREYPIRRIADRIGWASDDCFVFGDGLQAVKPDTAAVPVTFASDMRFAARGSLVAWQSGMGTLLEQHPVIAAMHAYSLAASLLRFLPPTVTNPVVELSSDPGKGKTSLAIAAAAFWGDDPTSSLGLGASFNATTNALEDQQAAMNDMLLMIDEVNLTQAGRGGENLAEIVHRLESGVGRRRHGDITGVNSRGARLITANRPLNEYVADEHKRAAVLSRIVTLKLMPSIFDGKPAGFPSEKAAADHMVAVARQNAGAIGRSFVRKALSHNWKNSQGLRGVASLSMQNAVATLVKHGVNLESRAQNAFALMLMGAKIATLLGVFKRDWRVAESVVVVARRYAAGLTPVAEAMSDTNRIKAYLISHGLSEPSVANQGPVTRDALRKRSGVEYFTRAGERMIAIHPNIFRAAFPQDHQQLLRSLKAAGLAQTEDGDHPRLSIKAPASVCASERVYSFRVNRILEAKVA